MVLSAVKWVAGGCALAAAMAVCGCKPASEPRSEGVVLYSSVDETFARQIVNRFKRETGIPVELVCDSEAGKTTGLVKRIRLESERPRADVFWSSEQSQTVLLANDGLFTPYAPSTASDIPAEYKDPKSLWTGFALRARVIAYDPDRTLSEKVPTRWEDVASPQAGTVALANPLFGTTRGQMAAMYALWGPEKFNAFLDALVKNDAVVVDGNSAAVRRVIAGGADLALTDTDDVFVARKRGYSLDMVFPDMGDGGTMLIPNTVALVAGAPHRADAQRLIDFIVSPMVEEMLARSESGNYPVREGLRARLKIDLPPASHVSFGDIADAMPAAIDACREKLLH